ncbi:hypothetical protein I302_106588 [Kwoniella bestiolae CBS 10118]|uniref:Uncharacterized protein n=1 Tax=Kwoniella bestiolae CBS 10118 TaxID=1296100 RepID=A0A1B9G101_9TREE|nr:hypothetical protein I302_06150 [Kwoniella bestiolae CBS 10118]OCF24689.1 hypothetical protein I302_06150 [Kwoniella bestiolae CBS 10118]
MRSSIQDKLNRYGKDAESSAAVTMLQGRVNRIFNVEEVANKREDCALMAKWYAKDPEACLDAKDIYMKLYSQADMFKSARPDGMGSTQTASSANEGTCPNSQITQLTAASTEGDTAFSCLCASSAQLDPSQRSGESTYASGDSHFGTSVRSKL